VELNAEEQKVWEILATPYVPQSLWDALSEQAIRQMIDEIKAALIKTEPKQNEIR
jgi:hypothetical protein